MPQRFLRPGITTSERWNSVSFEAQSLYVRILTLVDDFGRMDARVPILHGQCFALRNDIKPQRTAALRSELNNAKLIEVYEVEGREYLQMTQWQERARSERSKIPDKLQVVDISTPAAVGSIPQDSAASIDHRPSTIATTPSTIASAGAPEPPAVVEPAVVVGMWNATSLPRVATVTDSRKAALKARLSEVFFRTNWQQAIAKISASDFCRGATDRGNWKATFDWFVTPDAVVKVMEGKYDNGTNGHRSGPSRGIPVADHEMPKHEVYE